jgi:hypothetical protein
MLSLNKSNAIKIIAYLICIFCFENCVTLWYDKFVGDLSNGIKFVNTYESKISFYFDENDKTKLRIKLNPRLEEIIIEIPDNIGEEKDIRFDITENTSNYLPSNIHTANRKIVNIRINKPNHQYRYYILSYPINPVPDIPDRYPTIALNAYTKSYSGFNLLYILMPIPIGIDIVTSPIQIPLWFLHLM